MRFTPNLLRTIPIEISSCDLARTLAMIDYTSMPIGIQIDSGVIVVCPHCKLPGKRDEIQGVVFYKHQYFDIKEPQRGFVTGWKACPNDLPDKT